jgi:anti-sigma B factor antagonist
MTTVTVTSDGGTRTTTVTVEGELDLAGVDRLEAALDEVEATGADPRIDLRRTSFLDSTGLCAVLRAVGRARERGARLTVIPGPEPVHRVFTMTGADRLIDWVHTA